MPFFDELQRRTAAARAELFAIPVIQDCLAGRVDREQYLAFLAQAYHHVRHTVPLLMACGARLPERLVRHLVLTKLQAVGLRGAARLMPAELSGGMGRRVALARAIVMDPELLIYDEPFVGLDPISMGVVLRLIRRLNDTLGVSSIVVSHDVREITAVADHCHLLSGGRIVGSGSDRSSKAIVSFMPANSSVGSGSESTGLSSASRMAPSTSGTAGRDSGG